MTTATIPTCGPEDLEALRLVAQRDRERLHTVPTTVWEAWQVIDTLMRHDRRIHADVADAVTAHIGTIAHLHRHGLQVTP